MPGGSRGKRGVLKANNSVSIPPIVRRSAIDCYGSARVEHWSHGVTVKAAQQYDFTSGRTAHWCPVDPVNVNV